MRGSPECCTVLELEYASVPAEKGKGQFRAPEAGESSFAALAESVRNAVSRHATVDEQLYKDVDGVLEMIADAFKHYQQSIDGEEVEEHGLLVSILELLDGICCYFCQKPKPTAWVNRFLKIAKAFSPAARESAALKAQASGLYGPI